MVHLDKMVLKVTYTWWENKIGFNMDVILKCIFCVI